MNEVGRLADAITATPPPTPRFATVQSIDLASSVAVVRFPGSTVDVPAFFGGTPPAAGQRVRVESVRGELLIAAATGVDAFPGWPFAMAAGVVTVTVTAATSAGAPVTFPAGRFTVAPRVSLEVVGSTFWVTSVSGKTATGMTATVRHADNNSTTNTVTVEWTAVQMTSTSADG